MKKKINVFAVIMTAVSMIMVSCTDDLHQTAGEYTFKTSGSVTLTSGDKSETLLLNNETGNLSIINKDDKNDGIILTINSSYGPVQIATGRLVGKTLLIDAYNRSLEFTELKSQILQPDVVKTTFNDVDVSGNGERYGDTIIFTWTYEGVSTDGTVTLKGTNIKTIATRK